MIYLVITGLCAGFVGALFGLGGGIVIVPALTLIFGMPVTQAVGTSLVSVVAVSTVAAIDYLKSGRADMELGLLLASATSLGAVLGGTLAAIVPEKVIYFLFSAVLFIASFNMTRPRRVTLIDKQYKSPTHKAAGYGISFISGNLSGMLGVGGGIIQVTMMRGIMKMPMKISTATSSFMIGMTAAPAALIYILRGDLVLNDAAAIILGVFAGSRLGAMVSYRISSLSLRLLFMLIILFAAYKMFMKGL